MAFMVLAGSHLPGLSFSGASFLPGFTARSLAVGLVWAGAFLAVPPAQAENTNDY